MASKLFISAKEVSVTNTGKNDSRDGAGTDETGGGEKT